MKVNEYYRASSIEDAYQKLQASPKNAILAGGLWMKKMGQSYDSLIDLSKLGLDKISETKDEVIVGSMVSQRDFEDSKIVSFLFAGAPAFAVREVMGVNFRNLATIGGSIMGRYPFSDVITGLLPYDVELEFYPAQKMSLEEYLNYKGKLNAILVAVHIKKGEGKGFFKKVKTTALDFPIVNIAVAKVNKEYRVVVGARPMVAARSYKAMEYLNNGGKDFAKAAELAVEELSFMDNKDASKEYRVDLAKVYVRRGLEEVSK
jgi:CO/xanthine dehydrogenase FAD-binding subunit